MKGDAGIPGTPGEDGRDGLPGLTGERGEKGEEGIMIDASNLSASDNGLLLTSSSIKNTLYCTTLHKKYSSALIFVIFAC